MKHFLLGFLILVLTGCETSDNSLSSTFSGTAMTMEYRVVIGEPLIPPQKKSVRQTILKTFDEIDSIFNKWNPTSELSVINQAQANQRVALSKELLNFLVETDKIVQMTNGKFDPTVEPIQSLWRKKLEQEQTPSSEEIETLSAAIGWDKIHIEEGYIWKDHPSTSLDLGGIAKGYAIDLITERINQLGYPNVYVEWGGEIRTSGKHPEGRPWRILVSKLGNPDHSSAVAIVDMKDESVASSGDYLQNWTVDGITYFHVIDPERCCPLVAKTNTICSTTVVAPTCMLADALATAAMMFSYPEEAEGWLSKVKEKIPSLRYWVLTRKRDQERSTYSEKKEKKYGST